jgi:hypothetical protein
VRRLLAPHSWTSRRKGRSATLATNKSAAFGGAFGAVGVQLTNMSNWLLRRRPKLRNWATFAPKGQVGRCGRRANRAGLTGREGAGLLGQLLGEEPEVEEPQQRRRSVGPDARRSRACRAPAQHQDAAMVTTLNDRWRVIADDLQWIAQKRRKDSGRGAWESVIFCQTRGGLIANIGYEAYGVGDRPRRLARAKIAATPASSGTRRSAGRDGGGVGRSP